MALSFLLRPRLCSLFLLLFMTSSLMAQKGLNNERMKKIMEKEAAGVEGVDGAWQVLFRGHLLIVLTDETNNRMRIFTPVVEEERVGEEEMKEMLQANFHSALDAKYSLYEGFVISVFTHPLKELTKDQLVDAMAQVVNLSENFGTSYSSTELIFGPGTESPSDTLNDDRINKRPSKS